MFFFSRQNKKFNLMNIKRMSKPCKTNYVRQFFLYHLHTSPHIQNIIMLRLVILLISDLVTYTKNTYYSDLLVTFLTESIYTVSYTHLTLPTNREV